jgi:predicted permease
MFWKRKRSREDFAEEIRAHLALEAEELAAEGSSPEEAERRARAAFGGVAVAEERFALRGRAVWLENFWQDVRFGLRMMRRNKGFTAAAVLTLAVGIGVSTTAFSWVDAVLLRPLGGVKEPNRLVTLEAVEPGGGWVPTSYPDYVDFRDRLKLIDGAAVRLPSAFTVGQQDHAERVWGELVSGNFFAVLGAQPELGRFFLPSEYGDKPGAFPVAVLSDRFWRSHYHADPGVIGSTIRINQHELMVVGVAGPEFRGSTPVMAYDIWVPYMQQPVLNSVNSWQLRDRHNHNMVGIARLRDGVTIEQARAELDALARRMAVANADVSAGMTATLIPLWKSPHGPQRLLLAPLTILMVVSLLVLFIVCANVANLLLARATSREKELTARLALGAGRVRIVQQLLTEALLIAALGAVAGAAMMPLLSRSLKSLMPPSELSTVLLVDTHLNWRILAFTGGLCLLATLAAGLMPAVQVSRMNLSARLNDGGRSGMAGLGRGRLRSALVALEVALALVALVGAGLCAQAFQGTLRIDPGFDPDHVLLGHFFLNTAGYSLEQRKEFCRELAERMKSQPGVVSAAYSDAVPLGFQTSWWEELEIEGYARKRNENMNVFRNVVSPEYLDLLRIPILEGRGFRDSDTEDTPLVMVVNQAFVHRYFAGHNAMGARVRGWGRWFRIVGIARDSKYHYLGEPETPYFYVDFRQLYRADENLAFYVRTKGEPDGVLAALRGQARAMDANVAVFDAAPLREFIGGSLYPQKVAATLMTALGSVAVGLAAVGLYGVMAYSVAQRTQEIGVRMALGAKPAAVLWMVVRQALGLTAVGLVVGVGLTAALARGAASLSALSAGANLLGGSAGGLVVYAGAALFLCVVSAAAAWLPARRAAGVNPMEALRTA